MLSQYKAKGQTFLLALMGAALQAQGLLNLSPVAAADTQHPWCPSTDLRTAFQLHSPY